MYVKSLKQQQVYTAALHRMATWFSFAHFFIVRTMYSTWGFAVLCNICITSCSRSLLTVKITTTVLKYEFLLM